MSNFGNETIIDEQEVKEMKKKAESWWDKNGAKVLGGAALIAALLVNKKVNALESKTGKAFNGVAKELNNTNDLVNANLTAIYQNFRVARADLSNIATFVGYQGKLGCNNISEESV